MEDDVKVLRLVKELVVELEKNGVAYCHWKSNTAIAAALSGATDLDLLVDSEQEAACYSILSRLGFRRALDPQDACFPGISHFFAYDKEHGRLVHVHLHFHILAGDDLIKKYRLPVNQALLATSKPTHDIYLPPVEVEFIIFVLRMTLKRRLLSVLVRLCVLLGNPLYWMKVLVGLSPPVLPPSAQRELDDLSSRIDTEKLAQALAEHFTFLQKDLFQDCWHSLTDKAPRFSWLTAGRRLTRALAPYSRYSSPRAVIVVFSNALKNRARSLVRRCTGLNFAAKSPESGGRIIAFVGGDGAGKTTMAEETLHWLNRYFFVTKLHMGKPAKGLLWYLYRAGVKAWQLAGGQPRSALCRAVGFWLVARYRYRTFHRALWLRNRGAIVLLDRVPLPGSQYMDTPRIAALEGAKSWMMQRLAQMEEAWHDKIRADELIVLRLDPRIAALRRPDDDPQLLAKRSGEIWERQWLDSYAHVVDASQPLAEVMGQVRGVVWDILGKQSRVCELIGPAGCGKSTLAGELRNRFYNMQTSLSCRGHLLLSLAIGLRRFSDLVAGGFRGVPFSHLKHALYAETVLHLLQPRRRLRFCPGRNIVLEIGPLFYLAFLEKESGRFAKNWLKQLRDQLANSVDLVVWLDAADDLLVARIKGRHKWHRLKHGTPQEIEQFLTDYRVSFAKLLDRGKGDLVVNKLDTGELNPIECVERVACMLNEAP